MYYRFDECIEYMKKAGLKTKWREESEERVDLEQLSDIPGFEWIDEDSFVDMEKHPYFRMRGKRVTKEQAFDIISRESVDKRNHFIKRAENIIEESHALQFTEIKLHHTSRFDWIRSWIDPDGAVGETNYCAWKYPDGLRLMEEHMLNAKRYPFLKYVIVYTMHDAVSREDLYYEDGIFHDIEDRIFWGGFEYALWVHDGGVERVDRDKAKELYEEYQSEYPCEEMFMRDDWNKYIKPYLDEEYVLRLSKAWKQLEEEREEMLSLNIYECKTVEEYFKQNGIEYDKNFIYGIKRERNLNSFLMMGLIGLIMKAGMKPCYILFKENEILFFEVGMLGGIKGLLTRIDVDDIEKIDLKKGIVNYKLTISVRIGDKIKKEIINFAQINGKAWWIQNRNNLIESGYFEKLAERVGKRRMLEQ